MDFNARKIIEELLQQRNIQNLMVLMKVLTHIHVIDTNKRSVGARPPMTPKYAAVVALYLQIILTIS